MTAATESHPHVQIATVGVWIDAETRPETDATKGSAGYDLQNHSTTCLGPDNLLLGQPLGRTTLGPRKNIQSIKRADLEAYIKDGTRRYSGVDHDSLVQLAERRFSSLPVSPKPTVLGRALYPRTDLVGAEVRIRGDTIPTVSFALAVEGVGWSSPDDFPMLVLQSVFGDWDHSLGAPPLLSSRLSQFISANSPANQYMSFSSPS